MAKRLPKPFSRPSVQIGTVITRRWGTTAAENLGPGDMVPDRGQVVRVTVSANVAVKFFSGNVEMYRLGEPVWAFTEGPPIGDGE